MSRPSSLLYLAFGASLLFVLPASAPSSKADSPVSTVEQIEVTGQIQAVAIDRLGEQAPGYAVVLLDERAGASLNLTGMPIDARGERPRPGETWTVRGVITEAGVLVPSQATRLRRPTDSTKAQRRSAEETTRAQSTAVILVNLTDAIQGPNCTTARVAEDVFGTLDGFYREASFGMMLYPRDSDLDGAPDVFGPITLPGASTTDPLDHNTIVTWSQRAEARLRLSGVDVDRYHHLVMVFPHAAPRYSFGLGSVGCADEGGQHCYSMLGALPDRPALSHACVSAGTLAHEIGHNLGLLHAAAGGSPYGDQSDVMGSGQATTSAGPFQPVHPNAAHKHALGWLDSPASRLLRVRRPSDRSVHVVSSLAGLNGDHAETRSILVSDEVFISTRSPDGYDGGIAETFVGRTSFHRACAEDRTGVFGGSSDTSLLATIGEGEAFVDPVAGVRVEQLSHSDDDVTVELSAITQLHLREGRFIAEAEWRSRDGLLGKAIARQLSDDSGAFWFFDSKNLELLVKLLDGCPVTNAYWVFTAGLTNLEVVVRVTDTASGIVKEYRNVGGTAYSPVQDLYAFPACEAPQAPQWTALATASPRLRVGKRLTTQALPNPVNTRCDNAAIPYYPGLCSPGPTTLCLGEGGVFKAEVVWRPPGAPDPLPAGAVTLTRDSGYFWFRNPSNAELFVKLKDGCAVNGKRWVFAAGMTNQEVELTVSRPGVPDVPQRVYTNPPGTVFSPIQDTAAFPGCGV